MTRKPLKKTTEDYLRAAFVGEFEVITASQLRQNVGEILTQTSLGKTFCVKRKGRIVGYLTMDAIVPISGETRVPRPTLKMRRRTPSPSSPSYGPRKEE